MCRTFTWWNPNPIISDCSTTNYLIFLEYSDKYLNFSNPCFMCLPYHQFHVAVLQHLGLANVERHSELVYFLEVQSQYFPTLGLISFYDFLWSCRILINAT